MYNLDQAQIHFFQNYTLSNQFYHVLWKVIRIKKTPRVLVILPELSRSKRSAVGYSIQKYLLIRDIYFSDFVSFFPHELITSHLIKECGHLRSAIRVY